MGQVWHSKEVGLSPEKAVSCWLRCAPPIGLRRGRALVALDLGVDTTTPQGENVSEPLEGTGKAWLLSAMYLR